MISSSGRGIFKPDRNCFYDCISMKKRKIRISERFCDKPQTCSFGIILLKCAKAIYKLKKGAV